VAAGVNVALGADTADVIALSNPMTSEHAELRTTLLGSLLDVVRHNRAAGNDDVALFEVGRAFTALPSDAKVASALAGALAGTIKPDDLPVFAHERKVLALVVAGNLHGGRFDAPAITGDFPAVAGIVEALVATAGATAELRALPSHEAARYSAHPGQLAAVYVDGEQVGLVATVHPTVLKSRHIRGTVITAQLDLEALEAVLPDLHTYRPISTFPPVLQDIALIVPETVAAADLVNTVRDAGEPLLESVHIFDRYAGDQVAAGQVSLATASEVPRARPHSH